MWQAVFWNALYGFSNDGDIGILHFTPDTVFGFWFSAFYMQYSVFGHFKTQFVVVGAPRNPPPPTPIFSRFCGIIEVFQACPYFSRYFGQWMQFTCCFFNLDGLGFLVLVSAVSYKNEWCPKSEWPHVAHFRIFVLIFSWSEVVWRLSFSWVYS